jgi:3-phenylpropionate/trans-cinnamate dioxygenase ferredoxin reductase component
MTRTHQVVVVGAGLGGLRVAESLREAGCDAPLAIIGEEPHLPYNRPPLSKESLAGGISVEELQFRRRPSIDDARWLLGSPAVSSDLAAGTITLADGSVEPFAGLAIATGIRPRQLPIPGPTAGRFLLRNASDAAALREQLVPGAHLVILGAGFIGCEVAATARGLGVEVDVVALDTEPMIGALGAELGAAMRRAHEEHGVRWHLGRTVREFLGDESVTGVLLDDGSQIPATVVLEAVGSVPNTEWLQGNGLDLSDGVLVDETLRVVGSPRPAVAVGDIARYPNALFPGDPSRIEHWNMPTETGRRAGQTLAALMQETEVGEPFRALPAFWSDQYDLNMQSYGIPVLGKPVLVDGRWDGDCIVEYRAGDELVGVIGVNRTKDLMVYRKALLAGQGQEISTITRPVGPAS